MAKRFYITLGATTSAGGSVTAATSLLALDGIHAALEGDPVACPACDSTGRIAPDGARLSVREHGRLYALEDDLCLCGCDPAPRLVAIQRLAAQDSGAPSAPTLP